jgi:SCP-2 sterol transfer family
VTRLFDSWAHEQDVRRPLGRPGGRNGPGEVSALDTCASSMPYVVGKRVAPPGGTTICFEVTGVLGRRVSVTVSGGRAELVQGPASDDPDSTLSMDQETFWRLGFGRVDAAQVLSAGQVRIEGDVALGQRVLESMAFMI